MNTLAAGAAEKAYCYLNLCGMDVFTGCFFVDRDGKASLAPALLGEKQRIFETVMTTQARKLRGAYIEYADDIPGNSSLTSISAQRSRTALPGATNTRSTMRRCCISIHGRAKYGADTPTIPLTDLTLGDRIRIRRGKMLPYVEFVHPTEKATEMNSSGTVLRRKE